MTEHKCNWQLGEDGSAICLDCTTVIGADGLIESLQEEIAALRESLGLLQIGHDHKATLLASCEIALGERDEKISTLQSDLAAAKERESDLHRLLRAQSGLIEEQRQEIARAREALIKQWELVFTRSYSQNPIGRAEARYAREIAHTGEEVGNE